jgi:hypothetical protein
MSGIPINYTVLAFGRTKYRPIFHGTYTYHDVGLLKGLTINSPELLDLITAIASQYYFTEWKHVQEYSWPLQFKLWYQSFDANNSSVDLGTHTVQLSEVPNFIISESKES